MHSEAAQKRTRMVSGSMPEGRIWIAPSPSQDGSTVNDEITGSDEPMADRLPHDEHKERLMQRGSCRFPSFPLLGFARNARLSLFVQRQTTGQCQSRPTLQPVVHILIR